MSLTTFNPNSFNHCSKPYSVIMKLYPAQSNGRIGWLLHLMQTISLENLLHLSGITMQNTLVACSLHPGQSHSIMTYVLLQLSYH
jgi:hypothetical protein